jgi:hypothetical protein
MKRKPGYNSRDQASGGVIDIGEWPVFNESGECTRVLGGLIHTSTGRAGGWGNRGVWASVHRCPGQRPDRLAVSPEGYVGREAAGNLRPFPAPPETVDVR